MIYNIIVPYIHNYHIANLLHYITFRSGLSLLVSITFCFIFGEPIILMLKKWQKLGQPIREDGPVTHKAKLGTPTMGGLMILSSTIISTLLFADLTNIYIWLVLFVFISFGALGFYDDYVKVFYKNYRGISGKTKLIVQVIVGIGMWVVLKYVCNLKYLSILTFPFFKTLSVDLGDLYIILIIFIIVGSSNAVNLTDGLDGLAVMPVGIAFACFGVIAYLVGNKILAGYLQVVYVTKVAELSIFCAAIVGSCLGFLWYNAKPADVFMGDTGSLALGGALGAVSIMVKHELILGVIGGLFVIEALSVIIQVYYFKQSGGKRIFMMAPLHHHFEKIGWQETKVVTRFWIISILFAIIGLASLKIR